MGRKLKASINNHPSEPWLWREDWANGIVRHSSAGEWGFVFIGTMFLLVSSPGIYFLKEELDKKNWPALLMLIFPTVGVGLLYAFLKKTLAVRTYGRPSLPLTEVPLPLGSKFQTSLRTTKTLLSGSDVKMTLSCCHITVTGSGKNRSRTQTPLWVSIKTIKVSGREIPVEFEIPYDQKGTDFKNPDNAIVWRLEIESSLPGVDLQLEYDLPVFMTAKSNPEWTMSELPQMKEQVKLLDPGMAKDFSATPGGEGLIIRQRAFRHVGLGLMGMIFGLVFLGAGLGIGYASFHESFFTAGIFLLAFGGIGLFIFLHAFLNLVRSREVSIGARGIVLKISLFGLRSTQRFQWDDIHEFELKNSVTSGTRIWKEVRVRLSGRRGKTLLGLIHDPSEAEWLLQQLQSHYPKGGGGRF